MGVAPCFFPFHLKTFFPFHTQMKVWERNMAPISTPDNSPRLFDMVRVKEESMRPAFYFAMRDTLVATDMDQATRMAFQKDKRWRVVTLQGQIIEMAGGWTEQKYMYLYYLTFVFWSLLLSLTRQAVLLNFTWFSLAKTNFSNFQKDTSIFIYIVPAL